MILPEFSDPNKEYFSPQINGHGILASDTIKILERLTGRGDLERQTLSCYQDVLSKIKLFKTHKAWCPVCLNKMKNNSEIIYEKIIWSINEYELCLEHFIKLDNVCEKCGKFQRVLPNKGNNGYCQNCQNWLGKDISLCQLNDTKICDEYIYNAKQIEEMLNYFFIQGKVDYDKLHYSLITINRILPKSILLRELDNEVSYSNFLGYTSKSNIPTISKILKISWKLKINLVDLMINKGIEITLKNNDSVKMQKRYNYSVHSHIIKNYLEEAINVPDYKPVKLFAQELGVCIKTLRNNFPELIRKINQKNKKVKKPVLNKEYYNHKRDKRRVEKLLNECLEATELISLEEISSCVKVSISTLKYRFPNLIEEIKMKNKTLVVKKNKLKEGNKTNDINIKNPVDFDFYKVREKLISILESIQNEPVFIKDIVQNTGISDGRLRRNYRDIIEQISKKNKELKKRNEQRYYLECENRLIETIYKLWSDGIYPGVETLQKHLDFCVTGSKHLRTRVHILNELGIEKKAFFKR